MCNFGCGDKLKKKGSNKVEGNGKQQVHPDLSLKSNMPSHEFSSPSRMKTIDITEVFEIPSRHFATAEDVITAKGNALQLNRFTI